MTGSAGIRPNRQWRSRPQGRASSIQPSFAALYNLAKARMSFWSLTGSIPENIYAALPCARNDIAVGLAQADMQAKVSMLKSRIAGSSAFAKIAFNAVANSSPLGCVSSSFWQVEQIKTVWRNILSFRLSTSVAYPTSAPVRLRQDKANDSAYLIYYNPLNFVDRNP